MNPAAPVASIRTRASYASLLVLLALPVPLAVPSLAESLRVADLRPVALKLARALEVLERLVALPEVGQRRAQVVFRVRLVEDSAAEERRHGLPGEPLGARSVARAEKGRRLIGYVLAA